MTMLRPALVGQWIDHVLTYGYTPFAQWYQRRVWNDDFAESLKFERDVLDVMWQVNEGLLTPKKKEK